MRALSDAQQHNERDGKPGAEARVQRRIDQNIVFLQQAPIGESRTALLERRKAERGKAALDAYQSYQQPQHPTFASQPEPFWKLQRERGDGRQPREYTTTTEALTRATLTAAANASAAEAARMRATLPAESPAVAVATDRAAQSAAVANATASAPELLPNGSQSFEMLRARQQWWAKPDVYAAVGPPRPRAEEPFKLAIDDHDYLHRKLSSGPKKAQRGYPIETRQIAEKITGMPPPAIGADMFDDPRMAPFRQYTGATFKFLPSEPREDVPGQDVTSFDGYEFTQPLYSSFAADKTFQPPKLPPRPVRNPRAGAPALRERTRPSTTTGARFDATRGTQPSSAPSGQATGGLGSTMGASTMRPGTAALASSMLRG